MLIKFVVLSTLLVKKGSHQQYVKNSGPLRPSFGLSYVDNLSKNETAVVPISRAAKINNCSNYHQSIKIGTGPLYTITIKFKRGAKIFEGEMVSFWLKLRNAWTRHRSKSLYHQIIMI